MSALADATTALAQALATDDYPAYAHVPEDLITPCQVIQPAPAYLAANTEDGVTFADQEYALTVELYLVVELTTNEQAATDLDALLEHVLEALPAPWGLDSMAQPGPIHTADWLAHGLQLTLSRYITL